MGTRLVALGGGTGLASLLLSIKHLSLDALTAIVTVTDDGGSTGRLRRESEQQKVLLLPYHWEGPGRILGAPLLYEGVGGLIRHDRRALAEMVIRVLEEGL